MVAPERSGLSAVEVAVLLVLVTDLVKVCEVSSIARSETLLIQEGQYAFTWLDIQTSHDSHMTVT